MAKPKDKTCAEIFQVLKILHPKPCVVELRALRTRKGTRSGYFDDMKKLSSEAVNLKEESGIYVTLNPCNPALLSRSLNHLTDYVKQTTADADIVQRRWFPIDLDPVRPSGIPSTDREHGSAWARGQAIKKFLFGEGWPEPVEADSGNGAYLLFPIVLPNDDASRDLMKNCLLSLDLIFSDNQVKVDVAMFNAARIVRLFGSMNRKGDSTPERPHRKSRLLHVPAEMKMVSHEALVNLAALKPEEPKSKRRYHSVQFDVAKWITDYRLEVEKEKDWQSARMWVLAACPFNADHRSAAIIQFPSGVIVFKCFHNSCQMYDWQALRQRIDPNATSEAKQFDCVTPVYEETPEGLIYHKPVPKGGTVPTRLTNFSARIIADITRDDGAETQRQFELETTQYGKTSTIAVPTYRFASLSWVPECLGAHGIVYPGVTIKDHARAAIQCLSQSVQSRHVYQHTGWTKSQSGIWIYLHAGGAIGPDGPVPGIETALPDQLSRVYLPSVTKDQVRNSVRASLNVLNMAPDIVVLPLYCSVWRAPLGAVLFSIFLVGMSGIFKTELLALMQQHYGLEMNAKNLPGSWIFTPNALEILCFGGKDCFIAVDDFSPTGSSTDIARYHSNADRLFRAQGNHTGRGRLKSDGTSRPTKPPRGLICSTGEEIPMGTSLRSRMHITEVGHGQVCKKKLTECQRDASQGLYAQAMSGYLSWVAWHHAEIQEKLHSEVVTLRQKALTSLMHLRTPDTIAHLMVGLQVFLEFAQDYGISQGEADELSQRAWTALTDSAQRQQRHQAASDPALRYLELLRAAIAAGKAHLAGVDDEQPPSEMKPANLGWRMNPSTGWQPQGDRIGWVKGANVYLQPEASYAIAQKISRDTGEPLNITRRTLDKRLKERKKLLYDPARKDHITIRKMIGGIRREVLGLPLDTLLSEPPHQPDQSRSQGESCHQLASGHGCSKAEPVASEVAEVYDIDAR